MIKGVIFDLDGTLADTLPDLGAAMNKMLLQFGYPTRTREELRLAICYGAREFVYRSLPPQVRDDRMVAVALDVYRENYKQALTVQTAPYPGVLQLLSSLAEKGVSIAVYSNKPMPQTKSVVSHYFGDIPFVSVVGHVEGTPVKPDPYEANKIARKMGHLPSEIAFVGDSEVDMRTAKNAGMHPVGVLWGYRERSVLVDAGAEVLACDTAELEKILSEL